MVATNALHSLAYNALVRSRAGIERIPAARRLWHKLWKLLIERSSQPVATVIHGHRVVVNSGYTYPMSSRMFRQLNQPLVELVHQSAKAMGRPIHLVDVGAAVGDTVLLVAANCPGEVAHYHCVDGDPQFFAYLTHNLGARTDCTLYHVMLSSEDAMVPSLVRTHAGTASAQGSDAVRSSTLDALLASEIEAGRIDVIKTDIDGFDGRALAGARQALAVAAAVIFEWHPILYRQTRNDWLEPFRVLGEAGYTDLVWFNKFGEFSHFSAIPADAVLNRMAEYCLSDIDADVHWDVVAVRPEKGFDMTGLARMIRARGRASRW